MEAAGFTFQKEEAKVFFTRSISLVYCRLDVVSKSEWRKRKEEVWVHISPVDGRSSLLSAAPVNH